MSDGREREGAEEVQAVNITKRLLLGLFAVFLASVLVMGTAIDHATAWSQDTAAVRTVGTAKALDGVEIRYEAA